MKYKFIIIFLVAIVFSSIFFLNWRSGGVISFYDSDRDDADRNYITHLNCPKHLSWFNYCRYYLENESSALIVVLGDSLGLALSEYLSSKSINHLYLGAGSCPMLLDLVTTYSNEQCSEQLESFYKAQLPRLTANYDLSGFILVHSAAYISTIGAEEYQKKVQDSISKIQFVAGNRDIPLAVVDPAKRPVQELTQCLPRRFYSTETCELNFRPEQLEQIRVFEDMGVDRLRSSHVLVSFKLLEYKDSLHLSMFGVEKTYAKSLKVWLQSIGFFETEFTDEVVN